MDKLTLRQKRGIEALLTEKSIRAAASSAGVSRQTLYKWLASPHFANALTRAQSEILGQVTRGLVEQSTIATDVLVEVAMNAQAPANARVSAARAVLELAARLTELTALADRLARLEQQLEGIENGT